MRVRGLRYRNGGSTAAGRRSEGRAWSGDEGGEGRRPAFQKGGPRVRPVPQAPRRPLLTLCLPAWRQGCPLFFPRPLGLASSPHLFWILVVAGVSAIPAFVKFGCRPGTNPLFSSLTNRPVIDGQVLFFFRGFWLPPPHVFFKAGRLGNFSFQAGSPWFTSCMTLLSSFPKH